jgi:hypothetical protein
VIFVPSETGASDGDLEEKYVTARYRVWMDKAHYQELDAYIRKLQHDNPLWNALWNNCVEFGRSIAGHMGLKMPLFVWLEPKNFVTDLREMNGMKKEQLPLEDASNSLRDSESRTPLPPPRPNLLPAGNTQPAASNTKPAAEPKKQPIAEIPNVHEVALHPSTINPGSAAPLPPPRPKLLSTTDTQSAASKTKHAAGPKKQPVAEIPDAQDVALSRSSITPVSAPPLPPPRPKLRPTAHTKSAASKTKPTAELKKQPVAEFPREQAVALTATH